ncbi:unnamed protein product [Phytophthora lilii]|uniref:Unnamed protein product n=1 Tax=Phytophthora lilii TaxID=2077276 RepID=A0A9W6WHC9_9STRA|nr:unnamed protein product [Phytophthora lilii]
MVRVISPAFTNAQISIFSFRPCRDDYDEITPEHYRYRCGTVRKQTQRNGYSNLMQHVLREHRDYEATMRYAATREIGSLINFIRHSSQSLYSWLDWQASESDILVMRAVERANAADLPRRFGIMLDGWTHASEHYVAWLACYEKDGKLVTPLLSMPPLLNEPNDDLSARAHLDFLASMLARDYGVQLEQCRFVVGDNCSVNRLLATLMQVPLVGCASHRLNRAVQEDMTQHEEDLGAFENQLAPCDQAGHSLELHITMVKRYLQLLEFLDVEDDDIMDVMPAPAVTKRMRSLFKELKYVESVSKALQGGDVDLLDVQQWF